MTKNLLWGSAKKLVKFTHVDDSNALYLVKCSITGVGKSASPDATAVYTTGGSQVYYVKESVEDVLFALDQ